MNHKNAYHPGVLAAAMLIVAGCGGSGGNGTVEQKAEVLFAPTAETVPGPNDLAFNGSEDATLSDTGNADVDGLDGFSTLSSITASTNVAVDPASIAGGDSVRVFEITTMGDPNSTTPGPAGPKPATGIVRELTPEAEYTAGLSPADRNNRTVAVTPTAPLAPDTTYMVVLTEDLAEQGGGALAASRQYELAKRSQPLVDGTGSSTVESLSDAEAQQLEGVRQLTQTQLAAAGGAGVDPAGVIASWTFTTQTIGDVLAEVDQLAANADLSAPAFADTGEDTPQGAASIWVGVLTGVPYYLAPAANPNDPAPRQAFWEADTEISGERNLTGDNPVPRARDTVAIPVLVTIPNAGCSPCPVSIFQHGITTNRKSALGIADTLAGLPNPHATVAIDLPLHGLADTADPLYAGDENPALQPAYAGLGDIERTFELDLQDNASGAAGPDGAIDPSGTHFINLESLRTSRDNLRQAVGDLLALTSGGLAQINGTINAVSGGSVSLDPGSVDFIGQSLGGIVGTPFLALAGSRIERSVLSAPGGGIAKLLDGSPTFGPRIEEGIEAAQPIEKGTPIYEQFLGAAQTAIDSADPLNYALTATAAQDLLVLEIVGGAASPADQVIPNNLVPPFQQGIPDNTIPSPTAGTDPLAAAMGLNQVGPSNSGTAPGTDTIVRFTAGSHSSLINPGPSPAVTQEMQTIVATFLASGSTQISNGGVVADP